MAVGSGLVEQPHVPLPHPRCFYEEIFRFSDFGIDAHAITATLEAALARLP